MKSLICSLVLVLCSFFLRAQTTTLAYPVKTPVANGPTTEGVTNAMYGKFIIYSYDDTTSANADSYIKHQAFSFISTVSPIALWYRDLTNQIWLQLSVSGSPTVSSWLTRGNDLSGQSLPNRLGTKNGDLLNIITSDLIRMIIPAGGIVRSSSAQNKFLVIDTVGKEIYYTDGGGTTPTWQQTLTAGSTLTGNNTIAGGGFDFIMNNTDEIKFGSNAAAIIDINNPTNIIQIGDVGAVFQSTLFTVDASDALGKFTADNSIHDTRFGINTTSPDSALQVVGGIHGTRGLRLSSLTNLSTQNRLLGQFGTDGNVGYVTLTSPLSLSSGALSCPTCVTSAASLTANSLMIGAGSQGSSTTTASAEFATLGGGATAAELRFLEPSGSGTNYAGFKAPALAGNTIYTLPTAFPAGTYLMQSSSAGVLSFIDPAVIPGTFALTNGNGTTAAGTAVNLGGQVNADVSIDDDGAGNHSFDIGRNTAFGQIRMVATSGIEINGAPVQMNNYGAGAATFDASGNISSVSDIRLKNKRSNYSGGLKELMKINPIIYKWKPSSGMETKHDYIGFSAQNIRSSLGEDAIGINKQGYLSIQDRAILAVAINAIQELKELNDKQQKEIEDLKKKKNGNNTPHR